VDWVGCFLADFRDVSVRAWGFVTALFMCAVADVRLHVGSFSDP